MPPPLIVRAGATLPVAPGANTVMLLPLLFVTYKLPALSSAMPAGELSPVLIPLMVRAGATLPLAPGGYTVMLFSMRFVT